MLWDTEVVTDEKLASSQQGGKQVTFWDADGNRKWANFTFNFPSHNHIHIATNLFFIREPRDFKIRDATAVRRGRK